MKKIFLLLVVFMCGWSLIYAQPAPDLIDDTKTVHILVFEHLEKRDMRFVSEGATITYKLYSNPKQKQKGIIDAIDNEKMVVDGKEVAFADCSLIRARVRTDKEMFGGMGLGAGLLSTAGAAAIISSSNNVAGPVFLGIGVAGTAFGLTFMFNRKRFDMNRGWSVYGAQLSYE